MEVVKTTMAANRADGMAGAISRIWGRGGALGCECARDMKRSQSGRTAAALESYYSIDM